MCVSIRNSITVTSVFAIIAAALALTIPTAHAQDARLFAEIPETKIETTTAEGARISALVEQIQTLIALITQLQRQVESIRSAQANFPLVSDPSPVKQDYIWRQLHHSVEAGDTITVAQITAPETGDKYRYLNYLSLLFMSDDNTEPWETFETLTLDAANEEISIDLDDPSIRWIPTSVTGYGPGYSAIIYNSKTKGYGVRMPGDFQVPLIKLSVKDDAPSDRWRMYIPLTGVQIWSESTGHTRFGGSSFSEYTATFQVNNKNTTKTVQTPAKSTSEPKTDDFWSVGSYLKVVGVGVYEGTNSPDTTVTGGNRPGTVDVHIPKGTLEDDTMLVLTAYEPVTWNVIGDGADEVTKVFLSGYYDQDVVGLDDSVEVVEQTHEGGSREYFYFYDRKSSDYDELIDFLKEKTGVRPYNFEAGYRLEEATISWKG